MSWAEVPFGEAIDSSEPTQEEVGRVEKVLSEAEDEGYWFAASRDGNRVSHYRGIPSVPVRSLSLRPVSLLHLHNTCL